MAKRKRAASLRRSTVLDLFDLPVALDFAHTGTEAIGLPALNRIIAEHVDESVMRAEPEASLDIGDFGISARGANF